jgi:ethanolamine ammonia-lyase large subunit
MNTASIRQLGRRAPTDFTDYADVKDAEFDHFTNLSSLGSFDESDLILAASESGLARRVLQKQATTIAVAPGVLPQVLAPSVRAELSRNGMINILNGLPFGLGSSLLSLFASDQQIAEKVGSVGKLVSHDLAA